MKILYFFNSKDVKGGGEISLLELLRYLNKAKFKPLCILPAKGELVHHLKKIKVDYLVVEMPSLRIKNIFQILCSLKKINKIIKNYNIDIIHCQGTRNFIYAFLGNIFLRKPLIYHARVSFPEKLLIEYFIYFFSDVIICVSESVKRRFTRLSVSLRKLKVIYNGVDTSVFFPRKKDLKYLKELFSDSQVKVIGFVGRIEYFKGVHCLLQAFSEIIKSRPYFRLLLIGGEDAEYKSILCRWLEKKRLSSFVKFLGFQKNLVRFYSLMDYLVLPSLNEGFNRALIEAQAMGLVVIATCVGGNPEAVRNRLTGILIKSCSWEDIKEAIDLLEENPTLYEFIQKNSLKYVNENFSIQSMVSRIEDVYENIKR